MKKLFACILLLGLCGMTALAYFALPDSPYATITRVSTSETRSDDVLPASDGGWDYGDTTNTITEKYGGLPFEFGKPVQIEVYLSAPPVDDAWGLVSLQYFQGTTSGASTNWTTITSRTDGLDALAGVKGCHLGLSWTPPAAASYLVRIYAETTNGVVTAFTHETSITKDGNALTWDDHEVVGFVVTANTIPGSYE
jgi:hypothetical protein